jgi:predicted nuclease of predicted toxin-antitoxin system
VKILANENLSEPVILYLQSLGHDVVSCRSPELSGSSDNEVYQKAVEEGRLIVTMDKDFLRMRRFPPDACGGIVVVKIYKRTLDETARLFRRYWESLEETRVQGRLVIMNPDSVRMRSTRT